MTSAVIGELLEPVVQRAVRRRVGVVAGHLAADGAVTVRGAGRLSLPDGPEPGARTLFEIGSITKTFTALLLARAAVDDGLSLDTHVGELVPEVAGIGRDGVEITLRHLATHRSGLPRSHVPVVRGSLQMLRGLDPYAGLTEDGLVEAIRRGRVKRVPGTGRPAYSNSGYGLLGIALSRFAGRSYGDLVRTRITEPLGLHDTVLRAARTGDQRDRAAIGHHRRRTPTSAWPLDGLPGAGALLSTVTDLLAFARAHLVPPPGPLGEAVRLATAEQAPRIGLGWHRIATAEELLIWHNGGTGGFRSMLVLRPRSGDAVAMLTNSARSVDLPALRLMEPARTR